MSILANSITSNNTATTMATEVLKYRPQMQYLRTLIGCLILLRFHLFVFRFIYPTSQLILDITCYFLVGASLSHHFLPGTIGGGFGTLDLMNMWRLLYHWATVASHNLHLFVMSSLNIRQPEQGSLSEGEGSVQLTSLY